MTELQSGRLLPTKLLAKKIVAQETKVGVGLIYKPISVAEKEPIIRGTVMATGTGTSQVPMSVNVGEQIIFSPNCFQRLLLDQEDYLVLDVRDCLFIIPPEKD